MKDLLPRPYPGRHPLRAFLPALALVFVLAFASSLAQARGFTRTERLLATDTVAALWALHAEGIGTDIPDDAPADAWFGKVVNGSLDQAFLFRASLLIALDWEEGIRTVAFSDRARDAEAARAFRNASKNFSRFLSYAALEAVARDRLGWTLDRNAISLADYPFLRKTEGGLLINKNFYLQPGGSTGQMRHTPCFANDQVLYHTQGGWILEGDVREYFDDHWNPPFISKKGGFSLFLAEDGDHFRMQQLTFSKR